MEADRAETEGGGLLFGACLSLASMLGGTSIQANGENREGEFIFMLCVPTTEKNFALYSAPSPQVKNL